MQCIKKYSSSLRHVAGTCAQTPKYGVLVNIPIQEWVLVKKKNAMPTLQLLSKHGEEDGEVDGAAGLLDHGLQLLTLHIQLAWTAQRFGLRGETMKHLVMRALTV